MSLRTIWVFGDQLNRNIGILSDADPSTDVILMVESVLKTSSRPWHKQRLHFIVSSMRHFAADLKAEGFTVDYRIADNMTRGLADHISEYSPMHVVATEPNSYGARALLQRLKVEQFPSDQFLTPFGDFAAWASTRKSLKMEDFYRRQRTRLGYLMNGAEPAGGQWNFDHDNREAPPKSGAYPWAIPPSR